MRRRLAWALACGAALAAHGTRARAEWPWQSFTPGLWDGALELDLEASRQSTSSGTGSDLDFTLRRFQEKVTVGNRGFFLYDPRFAIGNAQVTLGAVQDRQSGGGEASSSRARIVGYAFDTSILPGAPYSGSLFANRTDDRFTLPFGRSELQFENRGASFRLGENSFLRDRGIPFFSSTVRAEQQRTREETTSVLGQSLERSERRNILAFDGHDGLEHGDVDWRYEFNDLSNEASPQNSFRTHSATVTSSVDFGPDFNRRWDSRLSYYRRDGASPYRIVSANEQLNVDHDSQLSSGYRYVLTGTQGPTGDTTTQDAGAHVRYERDPNITALADTALLRETLSAGTRTQAAAGMKLDYRRSLPWDGRITLHGSARGQVNDNELHAARITVTDEAQAAPSPLGAGAGFLLNQSFIDPSAIVVVDTRGGARLATVAGLDYDVVQEGNRIRIVPLLTSAVIQAGDPLAVTYVYDVAPSIRYGTTSDAVGAGLDFHWIAVSFAHERSNQHLISGVDAGFLEDLRKDSAQLDLRGDWGALQAQATLGRVRYDSTFLTYRQDRAYEFASWRATRELALGAAADWTRTDFALPEHRTESRSGRLTLDWYGGWGWTVTGMLSRRMYKDSLQPTETVTEATLRSRFEYGKITLVGELSDADRVRGGFETRNARIALSIVRHF